jgi:arginyl-tRNA synthetase
VRYAHAHAASILRWSAHLGLPAADAAQFQPRLLAHPREQALLDAMSWLPERVAGAARRGQPHVLAGYLEELSGTYLDWQECCSLSQPGAFPPGPDQPAGPHQAAGTGQPLRQARLMLVSAARTVLGTGLGLLGVAAPDRAS